MSNITFYIHPGLPKTASSFLEKLIFPQLVKKGWAFNDSFLVEQFRKIVAGDNVKIEDFLEYLKHQNKSKILISYDALCGDPYRSFTDRSMLLKKLFRFLDGLEVKILLTTRCQADWIESIYKQSLHEYYYTPFKRFVRWGDEASKAPYPSLEVTKLDWYSIYHDFSSYVGDKNVKVLPMELMKKDAKLFIGLLSQFFDEPLNYPTNNNLIVNKGYGAVSCKVAPYINLLLTEKSPFGFIPNRPFYYTLKKHRHKPIYYKLFRLSSMLSVRNFLKSYVDKVFPTKPVLLTNEQKQMVKAEFKESNQKLEKTTGHELSAMGY